MVESVAQKVSPSSSRDVKQFLTFTFRTSSHSLQQKYYEILSFLAEHPSGYASQIADYYNRDRREVKYALDKLTKYKIIKKSETRTNCVLYTILDDVKKHIKKIKEDNVKNNVKKLAGGVSDSPSSSSGVVFEPSSDVQKMSKSEENNSLVYRLHRHTAYCRYVKGSQPKLSKSRFKNQERYLISLSLDSGEWDVEFTKNYTIIRCPIQLGSLSEYQPLRDQLLLNLSKVIEIVERRYVLKLNLEKVLLERNNKFEIASQDPFCKWFATPYFENNITVHEQDFTVDHSIGPEVDLIEDYSGGEGVRKFQAMLDLSDNIIPVVENVSKNVLQLQTQMEEKESLTLDILEQISHNLKESSQALKDHTHTLEYMREEIQLSIEALRIELNKKPGSSLTIGEERKTKQLLKLIKEGVKTQPELARKMGYTSTAAISRELKFLIEQEEIEEEVKPILTGKRGRPKKKYKLVEK